MPSQWERKASAQPSMILLWTMMSMSCALRKPGFYPALMKPSVATCHPLAAGLSASLILHLTMASPLLSPIRSLPSSPSLPTSSFHILHSNCLSWLSPYFSAHCTSVSTVLLQTAKNNSRTHSLWNSFQISLSTTTPWKAAPLLLVILIFTTMCPLTPTPPGLSTLLIPSTSVSQSPLPLTDLVTFLTGSSTGRTMTPSCLPPPVLLSNLITALAWLSSTSSSLHPMQSILRPGTSLPSTSAPSDPIFRLD